MSPEPLEAILFDLDQTLLDRDAGALAWLEETLDRANIAHPAERAGLLEELRAADGEGYGDRTAFGCLLAERLPGLGMSGAEFLRDFYGRLPRLARLPKEVRPFLKRLKKRWRLGLVTNGGSATQRAKLRRAKLEKGFFEAVLISGEFGAAKPDPAIFREGLRLLGARASRTLFVGDHPEKDIAGAKAAGLRTCWIRQAHREPPACADWTVDRVWELEGLLGLD